MCNTACHENSESETRVKTHDQIASEAAQYAEEIAGQLARKAEEFEDKAPMELKNEYRRRASIAQLAARHARKCADEARKALQEGQPRLAANHAREALAEAIVAGDAGRVL